MKAITSILVSMAIGLGSLAQPDSINVLFIGNSYTGYNNLSQMVKTLVESNGGHMYVEVSTPGGFTLKQHFSHNSTTQKIKKGIWDYVVLQDQSQFPSFPDFQVQADVYPYAMGLDTMINNHNPCAETVFYRTWGRKNGDASNCAAWPPVCTYEGMDSLLHLRYSHMANVNEAFLSPVGEVWKNIRENHPNLELYASDGSHPSLAGSYAAACSFFTVFTRKDPSNVEDLGVDPTEAATIRAATKSIIYDDLMKWHVGEYDPIAGFNVGGMVTDTMVFGTVDFTNTSIYANTYHWDFGDGNTSEDENPSHTFSTVWQTEVKLTANKCSYSDTFKKRLVIQSFDQHAKNENPDFYPNPTTGMVHWNKNLKVNEIEVHSLDGKVILSVRNPENSYLDLTHFETGFYLMHVKTAEQEFIQSIIVE